MNTYDDAAFERFCSGLVNEGFSPVRDRGQQVWTGPLRPSLRPLTDATRMEIHFYQGWPLRYAHVVVRGLHIEHSAHGTICLWAEDDPAQIAGRDLDVLWERVDEWAATAQRGFRHEDRALDAYLQFEEKNTYRAELPFEDLVRRGSNGFLTALTALKRGQRALIIESGAPLPTGDDKPRLKGAFYLRRNIGSPLHNLDDIRAALTHRQAKDLERGLAARTPVGLAEPSGGYDFIVLAWPRHDQDHDAVVVGFETHGGSLRTTAMSAAPNDVAARKRRAGPDASLLDSKTVLVAGVGSVGGHVAVALASSGIGTVIVHDNDYLKSGNLVRHVCADYLVGYQKTLAVSISIEEHAPWTTVEQRKKLSHDPVTLAAEIEGVDLVVDCAGIFSLTAALAETCRQSRVPFITGALYHKGALARIQRQADGDTPIAAREANPAYVDLPPEDPAAPHSGFLELGCTALVNNTPPIAVLSTAAEIAHAAVDFLTSRHHRTDERIVVFQPLQSPLDRTGTFDVPRPAAGSPP